MPSWLARRAGQAGTVFLQQLNAGHIGLALTHAADLEVIRLSDALRLCVLMAVDSDPRFSKAEARWDER